MKRTLFLALALLLASVSFAQHDIPSPWKGPYADLGRNLVWGSSAQNGINNAFVINLLGPQLGACLFVQNLNTTAGHSFTLNVYTNADQQAAGYYTNAGAVWTPINIVGTGWTQGVNSYYVPSNAGGAGLAVFSVSPASGGRVAFVISGSTPAGGTDTANLFYTFGSPSPCSALVPAGSQIFVDARSITSTTGNINWVGFASGALFPGAPQAWRTCGFYLSATNTGGTTPTLNTYLASWDSFEQLQDDRVSFLQVTTGSSKQATQAYFECATNPHVVSVGALAPGTLQSGLLSDTLRLSYVLGGTSPAYTVNLLGICH